MWLRLELQIRNQIPPTIKKCKPTICSSAPCSPPVAPKKRTAISCLISGFDGGGVCKLETKSPQPSKNANPQITLLMAGSAAARAVLISSATDLSLKTTFRPSQTLLSHHLLIRPLLAAVARSAPQLAA
ncbi:hypothetical protein CASFOL_037737 [Castilleja foliolosa]|uniref:Uncharacterized protein n=1 Tax=Castilleja foliolosa TaxID=1961234 RepID=A0ABD3BJX1_9LAMI